MAIVAKAYQVSAFICKLRIFIQVFYMMHRLCLSLPAVSLAALTHISVTSEDSSAFLFPAWWFVEFVHSPYTANRLGDAKRLLEVIIYVKISVLRFRHYAGIQVIGRISQVHVPEKSICRPCWKRQLLWSFKESNIKTWTEAAHIEAGTHSPASQRMKKMKNWSSALRKEIETVTISNSETYRQFQYMTIYRQCQ